MFMPSSEEEEDDSLVAKVVQWFFENMEQDYEEFAKKHCMIFSREEELKHEYYEVFQIFQDHFEKRIEDYIVSIGSDVESFYAEAKEMQERAVEQGDDVLSSDNLFWTQVLIGALEFDTFLEIMRDAKDEQDEENKNDHADPYA